MDCEVRTLSIMSSFVGQLAVTVGAAGCLLYFIVNQDYFEKKSQEKARKMTDQVSFRDPKLIEEHKKKLEEMNKKLMAEKARK